MLNHSGTRGALNDSYLFNSIVVNRDFVEADDIESLGGSTILLLNGGLEEQKETPTCKC